MSALRAAPPLIAVLALWGANSSCSWTLDLDGYRVRSENGAVVALSAAPDASAPVVPAGDGLFYDYRFPRGAESFSIAAAEGLASQALAGDSFALTPGGVATARGGRVEVAVDGSFRFTPAGAPGRFWGTDELEYPSPVGVLRARLTVYPDRLRLGELAASGGAGFGVSGAQSLDSMGIFLRSLAGAGDVNGDGLQDFVLGLPGAYTTTTTPPLGPGSGAYVLFGTKAARNVELGAPPAGAGFLVRGDGDPTTWDSFGLTVAGAGDVNGDGFDDVLVTQRGRGLSVVDGIGSGTVSGAVYLVFGKPDGADVLSSDLLAGQGAGFVITGPDDAELVGLSAHGAGDVNGDARADIVLTAPLWRDRSASAVFVVFGKNDSAPVALSEVTAGTGGFALIEESAAAGLLGTAAGVGDINGDGLDDVAVGGFTAAPTNLARVQVIFGRREPRGPISLADLDADPSLGYAMTGAAAADDPALVEAAGDVNGDGLDDVLVFAPIATRDEQGAPFAADAGSASPSAAQTGIAYVVLGQSTPSPLPLRELELGSPRGFVVTSAAPNALWGPSSASGDVDADGHADLVFTLLDTTVTKSYAIFGTSEAGSLQLDVPSERVLVIEGDELLGPGRALASGTDFNGDGLDDLLIGAGLYDPAPQGAGGAYVAFGYDARGALRGRGPALVGGQNDDVFELPAVPPILVRGGHGTDTLRAGSQTPSVDLRARGRWESLEVIDVRGGGPHRVLLDEVAVRRLPENQPGFAFSLVRRLTVLGDAEDTLELEAVDFSARGGNAGRAVYGRSGVYYGLEVSQEMTFVPGAMPE